MSVHPNEIVYGRDFQKDVYGLPREVQEKLGFLIGILRANVFDSRLHTKPLGPPLQGVFSFRIIREYRVGFIFIASHTIKLLIADRRDRIYRRLSKKV